MATTEGAIVDRIRDLLASAAVGFHEATGRDFDLTPADQIDQAFVVSYISEAPIGQMGMNEEARGRVQIDLARARNNDEPVAIRAAHDDARTLISALVRDGAVTSGEYAVETAGRTLEIEAPDGAAYVRLRLTLPVSFEATI